MPSVQFIGGLHQCLIIYRAFSYQFKAHFSLSQRASVQLLVSGWFSSLQGASVQKYRAPAAYTVSRAPFMQFILISDMVRTRSGSRVRPRVRFSTPERETSAPVPAPVPSPVPEAVPDEPLGFRRYQTRMGPRAPSLVPRRRVRRARPSKRART